MSAIKSELDKWCEKNNLNLGSLLELDEILESAFKEKAKEIKQLKKENERLEMESMRLACGIRTMNTRSNHKVPKSITGDDEPCYWQRKEWIDYIFELVENVEILLTKDK